MFTKVWATWLGQHQRAEKAAKTCLTVGFIVLLIAYQTEYFKLDNYWFWVCMAKHHVIDYAGWYFVGYALKSKYVKILSSLLVSFALNELFEQYLGYGNEYNVSEFVFAIIGTVWAFYEYHTTRNILLNR